LYQGTAKTREIAMKKLETRHLMKMMWGCMAFVVLAIVLIASVGGVGAFFIIPCMLVMGAMMWMMMGPMGRNGGERR
jgi:hypothetical protein